MSPTHCSMLTCSAQTLLSHTLNIPQGRTTQRNSHQHPAARASVSIPRCVAAATSRCALSHAAGARSQFSAASSPRAGTHCMQHNLPCRLRLRAQACCVAGVKASAQPLRASPRHDGAPRGSTMHTDLLPEEVADAAACTPRLLPNTAMCGRPTHTSQRRAAATRASARRWHMPSCSRRPHGRAAPSSRCATAEPWCTRHSGRQHRACEACPCDALRVAGESSSREGHCAGCEHEEDQRRAGEVSTHTSDLVPSMGCC